MIADDEAVAFCADPVGYYGRSTTTLQSRPRAEYDALQLAGARYRFRQLRNVVPMLKKLADTQAIDDIVTIEDVAPVLFDHTMYKSYPSSLIENGRFDQLTRWLDKLTTHDLLRLDVSSCKSVDDWLIKLDTDAGLRVCHTSGTSGSFSFLPRSRKEWRKWIETYPVVEFQIFGAPEQDALRPPLNIPVIYPYYRHGGLSHVVVLDAIRDVICGSEDRLHCAYDGRLSADVMILAGRLRAAKARGIHADLKLSPDLLARRDELMTAQAGMSDHITRFLDEIGDRFKGQRIFMQAASPMLYQIAERGLERGVRNLFARDSVIVTGGGGKGIVLPDDWQATVKAYWGIENLNLGYGMSEVCCKFPMCEHGRYHLMPWTVVFLLDPDSGKPLPREGEVTGRYACLDLLPDTYWGGFISGDEVTIDWDTPCDCGRTTPHMSSRIQRYSEKTGEEDKLNCAAAPEAYEEAMEFLADFSI